MLHIENLHAGVADLDDSRRRVREAASKVETAAPAEPAVEVAALTPGATVAAEHLGVRGQLVEIAGSSATVRSGSVTVRVPLSALRPAAAAPAATVVRAHSKVSERTRAW